MLVYYSATNFRSINSRIELNMRAENRLRRHKDHVVRLDGKNKLNILRSSVIYGANASGKSNIIKSISFARDLVVRGAAHKDGINNEPFLLGNDMKDRTSSFYFEYTDSCFGDTPLLFSYGIKLNEERIIEESLYQINGENDFCIFEREFFDGDYKIKTDYENEITDDDLISLKHLIKFTSKNQLFLNEYKEKEIHKRIPSTQDKFIPSVFFFAARLNVVFPNSKYSSLHDDFYSGSIDYLKNISEFDTGISKFSLKNVSLSYFSNECIDYIEKRFKESGDEKIEINYEGEDYVFEMSEGNKLKAQKFMAVHELKNGKSIEFDLTLESDGTNRLLDLLPALSMSSKYGEIDLPSIFIIDEFDRSLHPLLSKKFFELFLSSEFGSIKDQLIVTTHESSLLDNDLLRRDEIWFTQKERDQSTHLYSLSEYSTRFDKDIEKAYLQGRFGAIPNLIKVMNEN